MRAPGSRLPDIRKIVTVVEETHLEMGKAIATRVVHLGEGVV